MKTGEKHEHHQVLYLGVGEAIAAHAVGENDNGPGAGARSRRQLRLVDTKDPQQKVLIGNWRLDDTNAQHMRSKSVP
jgi:hypothetical protein